jgi:hypothetical protein
MSIRPKLFVYKNTRNQRHLSSTSRGNAPSCVSVSCHKKNTTYVNVEYSVSDAVYHNQCVNINFRTRYGGTCHRVAYTAGE